MPLRDAAAKGRVEKLDGGHDSNKGDKGDGGGTGQENDQQFDNPLAALPEIETHWETRRQKLIYGVQGMGFTVPVTKGSNTIETTQTSFCSVGDTVQIYNGATLLTTTVTSISLLTNIVLAQPGTERPARRFSSMCPSARLSPRPARSSFRRP